MNMNSPPPPPPPFPPPVRPSHRHRRLRRDRANGILGGVCAGIARTYDLDVTLVRVLWVVAGVLWIGVPAYIVAWIAIVPASAPIEGTGRAGRSRDVGMLLGLTLIGIGVLIAGNRILPHGFRFDHFGAPVLLIGGGLAILLIRRRTEDERDDEPIAPPAVPPAPRPYATGPSSSFTSPRNASVDELPDASPDESPVAVPDASSDEPTVEEAADGTEVPMEAARADAIVGADPTAAFRTTRPFGTTAPVPPGAVPPSAWTQTAPWPAPPSARALRRQSRIDRRARRPRSFLTPLTLSILLIGGGIASLLQATGALDVNLTVVLALGVCVVGAALVFAAFAGRAHSLILVGLLLVGATAVSNTIDVPLRGGIGSREYRPLRIAALQQHYELGVGQLSLDLRDLPLTGRTTDVAAQTGIGHLVVFVPSSVRVEVTAHAGAGSVMLYGHEQGGWPEDDQRAVNGSDAGVLRLDLRVGAGQVEVRRFEPGGVETILNPDSTVTAATTTVPITVPDPSTPPEPTVPPEPTTPAKGNG